jgi:NTP pyrophosphatase (non-canonical NTP hydrolase)
MESKKELTLNEYQEKAMTTCLPTSKNWSYMFLNLVGEVGEFSSKVAKHIRKEKAYIDVNHLITECGCSCMSDEEIKDLQKEVGDVLWQLSGLCSVMGWSLNDIAQQNLDKLASRQQRNVIEGNGDNR